ncbi:MAG: DUF3187 family protein [Gemmatimonadota bacterium]
MKTAAAAVVSLLAWGAPLLAQSLPFHRPLNPFSATRSTLAHQPYESYAPARRAFSLAFEYGNAIEYEMPTTAPTMYLLDAELMRASMSWRRDLAPHAFLVVRGELAGSYAGFADGFFFWYHDLINFEQPEREARPRNVFASELDLPDGRRVSGSPTPIALGDLEATVGFRHSLTQQTTVTVSVPTATTRALGRGVPGAAVVHTLRVPLRPTITFEGSLGAGFTPRAGDLSDYQRTVLLSGSTGIRWRLWGGESIYGYFFYHSPRYEGTTFPSLDRREITGDFGWIRRARDGSEWRIGFSEDLAPGDGGIDLVLKVGRSW